MYSPPFHSIGLAKNNAWTYQLRLHVGHATYFASWVGEGLGGRENRHVAMLGFEREGTQYAFSGTPYDDDAFCLAVSQFAPSDTEVAVLVNGERVPVDRSLIRKVEPAPVVAPIWCPVANMTMARPYGPDGQEIRHGSKHFAPAAKLYCYPPQRGDGYDQIKVIGRHRATHRFVTMIISSKWLVNWRADLVYSPYVVNQLWPRWDGDAESKLHTEDIIKMARWHTSPHRDVG